MVHATATVAAVASAGVAGATMRLLLYPQFVLGASLVLSGIVLRLSSAIVGIALLVLLLSSFFLVGIYLNDEVIYVVRKTSPIVARFLKRTSRSFVVELQKLLQRIPPWFYTCVVMAFPALARMAGTYSTARLLMFTKAKRPATPSGNLVIAAGALHQMARWLGLGEKPWASGRKIHFMLQSLWVMYYYMVHASETTDPEASSSRAEAMAILPSLLVGWGGLILSFMPDDALVSVVHAGASTAAVAGTAAATAHGVAFSRSKKAPVRVTSDVGQGESEDGEEENLTTVLEPENKPATISEPEDKQISTAQDAVWSVWEGTKEGWESWVPAEVPKFSAVSWSSAWATIVGAVSAVRTSASQMWGRMRGQRQHSNSDSTSSGSRSKDGDWEDLYEAVQQAGVMVQEFSPPLPAATVVFVIREFDAVLVLLLAAITGGVGVTLGRVHVVRLFTLGVLVPFAVTQVLMFTTRFNHKWSSWLPVWLTGENFEEDNRTQVGDGLSLLLWDQPLLLGIWKQFSKVQWDNAEVMEDMVSSIMNNPTVALSKLVQPEGIPVPPLTRWIAMKLLLSFAIDFMGIMTYFVPGIGELADAALAPLSAYLIHQLYGNAAFSWLGFFEEILPFTDIIPTATLAWLYAYGAFIPIWWEQEEFSNLLLIQAPKRRKSSARRESRDSTHFKLE